MISPAPFEKVQRLVESARLLYPELPLPEILPHETGADAYWYLDYVIHVRGTGDPIEVLGGRPDSFVRWVRYDTPTLDWARWLANSRL